MIDKHFDIRNSAFELRTDSDWFRKDDDVRWQYGVPPRGNANFAWVQHFIHHLAPHGMAGFVRFWFWIKSETARVLKVLDNSTPDSLCNTAVSSCSLPKNIQLIAVICGA